MFTCLFGQGEELAGGGHAGLVGERVGGLDEADRADRRAVGVAARDDDEAAGDRVGEALDEGRGHRRAGLARADDETAPDPTTFADARAALVRHGLWPAVPDAVRLHLEAGLAGHVPETIKPGDPRLARAAGHVVASGRHAALAAAAAARAAGLAADVLATRVEGEAREFGRLLAALARGLHSGDAGRPRPACWVLSGETTVALGPAAGRGGRNQEAALAAAIALAGCPDVLVACLGTDGTDGNTDAAGALVDGDTLARAHGRDPHAALAAHDSHPLLAAAGALLRTGPTLTNVGDLALVLAF